jgi:hypothetical protein
MWAVGFGLDNCRGQLQNLSSDRLRYSDMNRLRRVNRLHPLPETPHATRV